MPQQPRPWTDMYQGLNDPPSGPQVHSMDTPPELAQPTGRYISGGIILPAQPGNQELRRACESVNRQSDTETQQTNGPLSPFNDAQPQEQAWATAAPSPMGPNGTSPFQQEQQPPAPPTLQPQFEPQTPNNFGCQPSQWPPRGPPQGTPGGYGGGYGGPPPGGGAIPASFQVVTPQPWQATPKFEICRKKNDALKKFSGTLSEYGLWRDRVLDHLCRTNRQWRTILETLQSAPHKMTKAWLLGQSHCGYNGWELSETLEAWLVDWLSDSFYHRRKQLSGGEKINGFEMWRWMFNEFQGGSDAINLGGTRRLQDWPGCNKIDSYPLILTIGSTVWRLTQPSSSVHRVLSEA